GAFGVLTLSVPSAAQSYTFALPVRMYSSSTYPSFERSIDGVLWFAAINGYESAVTGTGPVTFGTGVALTAKSKVAIAASMVASSDFREGYNIRNPIQKFINFGISNEFYMTLSCPH